MAKATKRAWGDSVPNRDEQFELKRQVVLRTAARTYSRRGFHETTLADIAEELNVSKPTLYYYFRSKDEILFECHRLAIEAITAADRPMPSAQEASGMQRLDEFLRRYVHMVVDDFGTCLVMTGTHALEPDSRSKLVEGRRQINSMLREILAQAHEEGAIHCPDTKLAAMFVFGAMNWIPRWYHPDGSLSVDALAAQMTAFITQAVRELPAPAG